MEGCVLNKQGTIQAIGHVFWTVQFTGSIPKNDEQHLPRTTSQRSTGKLYGQFCYTCKDYGRTGRKDDSIFEDSGETQSMFQMVKM